MGVGPSLCNETTGGSDFFQVSTLLSRESDKSPSKSYILRSGGFNFQV